MRHALLLLLGATIISACTHWKSDKSSAFVFLGETELIRNPATGEETFKATHNRMTDRAGDILEKQIEKRGLGSVLQDIPTSLTQPR
jgi:hypothetical protein